MKDIKGISPTIVQYIIHLNDEVIPRRNPQRRLNPLMQDAVKTEILKLLDNGIIYPILIGNGLVQYMLFLRKLVSWW